MNELFYHIDNDCCVWGGPVYWRNAMTDQSPFDGPEGPRRQTPSCPSCSSAETAVDYGTLNWPNAPTDLVPFCCDSCGYEWQGEWSSDTFLSGGGE